MSSCRFGVEKNYDRWTDKIIIIIILPRFRSERAYYYNVINITFCRGGRTRGTRVLHTISIITYLLQMCEYHHIAIIGFSTTRALRNHDYGFRNCSSALGEVWDISHTPTTHAGVRNTFPEKQYHHYNLWPIYYGNNNNLKQLLCYIENCNIVYR